jgi:hypothetical protein
MRSKSLEEVKGSGGSRKLWRLSGKVRRQRQGLEVAVERGRFACVTRWERRRKTVVEKLNERWKGGDTYSQGQRL